MTVLPSKSMLSILGAHVGGVDDIANEAFGRIHPCVRRDVLFPHIIPPIGSRMGKYL